MELIGEDLSVRHPNWGRIHVRNKRPANVDKFEPGRIVVMQHGATYGSAAFDLPFGGLSWMDYIAGRGFDVYCIDLPGYGRSERPSQMREPAESNPPFMRTADAADCLGTVIDFVCQRRGVERLCLVGWSWGTAITSYFAAGHDDRVERLALYAPVWDRTASGPSAIQLDGELGAYRTVDREATIKRRQAGLTAEMAEQVMPREWFDMWWDATSKADADAEPGTIRAPNGVVQDGREYWNVGRPLYDPSRISRPVLVIVGEWDLDTRPDMAIALYPLFRNAAWKRLEIVSGGTHSLMMERNRMLLFRSVQKFLEELPPGVDTLA
jgi:pimeloyl-ACP methyl ester carboxylesterase